MPRLTLAALVLAVASPLAAQGAPPATRTNASQTAASQTALRIAPSGRATTSVTLRPAGAQAEPGPGQAPPLRITIDYGQPHARGREIVGKVVPLDSVWRTGANEATALTTDVDLVIGNARVPKGRYTLFTLPSARGWKLIISKQTGQPGTEYRAEQDLARIDLRARTLREPLESFSIWLVPAGDDAPRGTLRLAWGTQELSTDWRLAP